MFNKKLSLIGAGNIGGTIAHMAALKNIAEIVLVDIVPDISQGKALDISQMMAINKQDVSINGYREYKHIKGSDVIIVTAGLARKPGMSRDDLVDTNKKIISDIAREIANYSPSAFVIVVTNPLDIMSWIMLKETKFMPNKIVGMAGILDSARFAFFISRLMNVSVSSIDTMVLGSHGDTMVPLTRYTTISGIPLIDLIKLGITSKEEVDNVIQRTRDGGAEIVKLLGSGSAFYAPARAALQMAESYMLDQKKVIPITAYLDGEYDKKDIYVGVPAIIGKDGVEKIIELDLNQEEQEMFDQSAIKIKEMIDKIKN